MDFTNKLKDFSKRIEKLKDGILTEEATKTSLVMPFFNLLGYDVFNPMEFCPEYIADVGIKKGEKVDYAILNDGSPLILIECKSCTDNLEKHSSQLYRYFGTSEAKFGILTNGVIYKFFTDLEETNKMDLVPFLVVDMSNLKDSNVNELKKFCKENFDQDKIFSTAEELKYSSLIKDLISKEFDSPSDEFIRFILAHVYDGPKTQKIVDKFTPVIKKTLSAYINEMVNNKISSALADDDEVPANEVEEITEPISKVNTTEEEIEAYYIVRGILAGTVPVEDVVHRDTESYFGILYKDNNRKPICRINFDRKQKQIMIPDANKNFTRYYLDRVDDIYSYKAQLVEVVKNYL